MNRTVAISEAVFDRLVHIARDEGLPNIEALLERWASSFGPSPQEMAIQQIRKDRSEILAKYGEQPDSTTLIREDRDR
jgi:hypothetical protein